MVTRGWEAQKAAERAAKADGQHQSALDGIAGNLPALTRALKLQKRAARIGFDWPDTPPRIDRATLRILANMVFVASECVIREGRVTVKVLEEALVKVAVEGRKCSLREEWAAALDGEADMSVPGVAPALLLATLIKEMGGTLTADTGEDRVAIVARF